MTSRDPRRRAPQSETPKIEAVAAATSIIDLLAEHHGSASVQKVAGTLGITKSRASRHLANLELLGVVARVPAGRGYQLGWRVLRWGQIAAKRYDLSHTLAAPLRALSDKTNQTVLLCAPAGADAIVLQCLPPASATIRIEVNVGLVLTLPYSPSARIAFAFQPREQREILLGHIKQREAEFRIDDEDSFRSQIAAIQHDHYCWDRNKYNVGYGAIAAPVFDREEVLIGVVTIVTGSDELDENTPPAHLVQKLLDCCAESSALLGSHIRFPQTMPQRL
jgi:DNA-binding IclR family transcriptional regulator